MTKSNKKCCTYIVGTPGPKGNPGAIGPQGPSGPQSWVQLYDRNFTNVIPSNGTNLNLSNQGINTMYTTGGYSLKTTSITNDTLVLPASGYYKITISLNYSFLLPADPDPVPAPGSATQIIFNILSYSENLGSLSKLQIIPADADAVIQDKMEMTFIHNFENTSPELSIQLANFNFDYAFENQLSVYSIIVIAEKMENLSA